MFESSSYGLSTLHRHFTAVFSREFLSVFAKLKKKEKTLLFTLSTFIFVAAGLPKRVLAK